MLSVKCKIRVPAAAGNLPLSEDASQTCWGVEAPSTELSWLSPPLGCCWAWLARVCSSVAAGVVLLEAFPASLRRAACTTGVLSDTYSINMLRDRRQESRFRLLTEAGILAQETKSV